MTAHLFHAGADVSKSAADADGVSGQCGASLQSGPVTFAWMNALSAATPIARMTSSCAAFGRAPACAAAAPADSTAASTDA